MSATTELARWTPPAWTAAPTPVPLPPMLVNVLESLCEGKTNAQIAGDWGITENTVKTHLKRLFAKLGARDRAHATALVLSGAVEVRLKPYDNRWSGPIPAAAAPVPAGRTAISEWL